MVIYTVRQGKQILKTIAGKMGNNPVYIIMPQTAQ